MFSTGGERFFNPTYLGYSAIWRGQPTPTAGVLLGSGERDGAEGGDVGYDINYIGKSG